MEKQVVVRLLRGYFNCCSNKWKMIYIMKKDTWVIVRLQYFSCCSTIRKYFVKIFTHFESDLKVIVKYLMGHWSCWLFNTFACKYEKSTISWLKSHQYSICYMEEQNYPQYEKSHFILTVIWDLESLFKKHFLLHAQFICSCEKIGVLEKDPSGLKVLEYEKKALVKKY